MNEKIIEQSNISEKIPPELLQGHLKDYISNLIKKELEEFIISNDQRARELSLMERVVRVEEELKALREIESARFEAMEKRFEALQRELTAKFEAIEKRFEAMDKRFEALQREMNARFEAIDKRFEAVDKRFEAIDKRLGFIQWFIGIGFSALLCINALMPIWIKLFK